MKPQPPPNVPGNTEAEKFDSAVKKLFTVSKEAYLKEEAKRARASAKRRPKSSGGKKGS
jgi:hypothetical protein